MIRLISKGLLEPDMKIEKWRITGLVFLGLVALAGFSFSAQGLTEEAIRSYIRSTAHTSLTLFLLAFSASSLRLFIKRDWTFWLLRSRRYIGLSFALSHALHLCAIILLANRHPHPFLDELNWVTILAGGLAYVFILAMSVTSFKATKQWLGSKYWGLLHTVGSYYIWFIFTQSYLFRSLKDVNYLPLLLILIAVFILRLARRLKNRGILFAVSK